MGKESMALFTFDCALIDTDGDVALISDDKKEDTETQAYTADSDTSAFIQAVPSYDSGFSGVLTMPEFNMETGKPVNDARPKKTCFNCLGDHNLSECQQKHDYREIAKNRKIVLNRKRTGTMRYHEDVENRFGQILPGMISKNLRHALGLRHYQLPEYIYRMRVLGYPPGWLKEAEVSRADVVLYDGNGIALMHPDEEEGETDNNTVKYQPEKLVTYPGFNAPLPGGMKEEGHLYNCPRLQSHHQRSEFEYFMSMNKAEAYKQKKFKIDPSAKVTSSSSHEMELDDSQADQDSSIEVIPPLPKDPDPTPPPLPPEPEEPKEPKEEGEISDDSEGPRSPVMDTTSASDEVSAESALKCDEVKSVSPSVSNWKQHHRSDSKGFSLGVHIPESCTLFKQLPSSEKWVSNVSEHINFENLPDTIGTWDKMKDIMNKVKNKMHLIHRDDD